ncbi:MULTISPECIES: hypothetical protein [unclassified Luteimonas]
MAGCVLRAAGPAFAPEAFLASFPLPDANHRESSLNVLVSDRDGDDLSGQVLDALSFLREHAAAVKALVALPGVSASLDFGLWQKDTMSQSVSFAPDLVALAGELGLGLEASLYAVAP